MTQLRAQIEPLQSVPEPVPVLPNMPVEQSVEPEAQLDASIKKTRRKLYISIAILFLGLIAGAIWFSQNKSSTNDEIVEQNPDLQSINAARTINCDPDTEDYYRTNKTFTIDPKNSNILYVAIEYKGVFKSTDKGKTWKEITKGINTLYDKEDPTKKCFQEFGKLIIDSKDSNHILLSRIDSPGTLSDVASKTAGLWESKDGGKNWQQLISWGMNASGSMAIAFDPRDSKIIYYGINNSPSTLAGADKTKFYNSTGVLYKTIDGGKNWTELKTGVQKYLASKLLLIDQKNPDKMILGSIHSLAEEGSSDLDTDQSKSLLLSEDAGKTWQSIADRLPIGYRAIKSGDQSSMNPDHIFLIPQQQTNTLANKAFYSLDGGKTFKQSQQHMVVVAYDPKDKGGSHLFGYAQFTNKPGIFASSDGGISWLRWSNLPKEVNNNQVKVSGIVFDPDNNSGLYLNGQGGYVWHTSDSGKTWQVLISKDKV